MSMLLSPHHCKIPWLVFQPAYERLLPDPFPPYSIPNPCTDKRDTLSRLLRESPLNKGSVVVYVWRQVTAEAVCSLLQGDGHNAVAYHAGMEAGARQKAQNAFMRGGARVVVATIAFGLGVDMRSIRGVVHFDMPKSIENYVQVRRMGVNVNGDGSAGGGCCVPGGWDSMRNVDRGPRGSAMVKFLFHVMRISLFRSRSFVSLVLTLFLPRSLFAQGSYDIWRTYAPNVRGNAPCVFMCQRLNVAWAHHNMFDASNPV